jgi:pimeloyl-ACP methyl ester carboxylesterase
MQPHIHFIESGAGAPVVLIHGALTSHADMALALMAALSDRFRVLAPDRPNHGASGPGSPFPAAQAEALRTAMRTAGAERMLLVGHSMGGAVALAWALAHPDEVAGVVLVGPICYPELRLEHLFFGPRISLGARQRQFVRTRLDRIAMPAILEMMFSPQPVPGLWREAVGPRAMAEDGRTFAAGAEATIGFSGLAAQSLRYQTLRPPIRILAGDADHIVDRFHHSWPLSLIAPRARFAPLPGLGHMAHHFAQAEIKAALLELAALAEVEAGPVL